MMMNLKSAIRMLLRTPLVTLVALVSLSLGIGANVAIFSIFHQMLLRALPVREPERVVNLSAPGPKPGSQSCNQAGDCEEVFSYPMFRDLEKEQTVFTGIAAHRLFSANLAAREQTMNGDGLLVSGSYFPLLGIHPALGRLISDEDDRIPGESHVVVLSHAYWQAHFGRDPGVLNESLTVNGRVMTIVGVAPSGFDGTTLGAKPQVFVPITMRGLMQPGFKGFENRSNYWAYLFARLKPGGTLEQAHAVLNGQYQAIVNNVEAPLQKGMSELTMKQFRAKRIVLMPGIRGQSSMSGEAETPLRLLLGVTALVLVIACANVANLLLARSAARANEMAVRLSIGASRRQLVMQLLTESFLMAALAGCASILVGRWTLYLIASLLPAEAASALAFELELPALFFTAVLTLGTGLLFGLFPALHSTRPALVTALKDQAGQPSGARSAARVRTALATIQIALALALLVAAGLFTRSLFNVSRVNLGVKIDHIITFRVSPALNGYSPQRSLQLFERLEDELSGFPGVTGVSSSMVPLLGGSAWGSDVSVQGYKAGPDTDMNSRYNEIGPAYFRTLGVPLISGREFTRSDVAAAPKVAIVNEAFAGKFNLGRDAVGKRIGSGEGKLDTEIVGLVRDAKYSEVKDAVPPLFFRPYRQNDQIGFLTFYVRTALVPEHLLPNIAKLVSRLDPNLPVENLRTMPQQVRENVFLDRMIGVLSTAFACLATLLAAVGLYGVLAYTVAQRTREIGLRMALGATPPRVRAMVLRQVGIMTLIGGTLGIALAAALGRYAQSLLYQLKGADPAVMIGSTLSLTLVALAAGYVPAHRASKVDPMRALRDE
jgi:predicted permease